MNNRLKSFLWRLGAYVVVSAFAWITQNIGLMDLNPQVTTILALILGEITKAINTALNNRTPTTV